MTDKKIKSLFYESPKPSKVEKVKPVAEKLLGKKRILSIIGEGVLFGTGPKLFGTGQSNLGLPQAKGGGGGWAGPIAVAKRPGETQFGIIEDDMNLDKVSDDMDKDTSKDSSDTPNDSDNDKSDDTNTPPPTSAPPQPIETPEQKIQSLYTDTGDIDNDYSLTNENNIRLEKFKYTNIGLDLTKLIPEDELKTGISAKEVMNLLTPSQRDMLRDKNRELRRTYPLIDKREKNIILHNSNIPIYNKNNELSTDMKKQAYEKINSYLEQNFGKNWQDKSKAISFLRTIKINFSEKPAIRANLIDLQSMITEEGENYKIPLDKVNVMIPALIRDFIKANKEDPLFVRSNIFRTLISGYNQESGATGQVYVIFNSQNLGDDESDDEETEPSDENSEDESDENPEASSDENAEEVPEVGTPAEGEEVPAEGGSENPPPDEDNDLDNSVPPLPAG